MNLPNDASADQSNCPDGYYRRSNGMVMQIPAIQQAQQSSPAVDINDSGALKALAMETLVEIVQTAPRNVSLVGAIRELIDRIDGKAPQSVSMTVKQDNASKLSDDQLAALLAMLPDPVIIPPMPKKLDVVD